MVVDAQGGKRMLLDGAARKVKLKFMPSQRSFGNLHTCTTCRWHVALLELARRKT